MAESGVGFDVRLSLIDPETGAILQRSKNWDLYTDRESAKNLIKLGLLSSLPQNPGGRTSVPAVAPQLRLAYRVEVKDPDGAPKSDTGWVQADSMTIAFIKIFLAQSQRANAPGETVDDINGVSRTFLTSANTTNFRMNQGGILGGPVVGTSAAAVTIDDTALGVLITDGAGAGQLTHGVVSITLGSAVGTEESFTVSRLFTNNSGGNITLEEVGLHGQGRTSPAAVNETFLFARDLVGSSLVQPLQVATVTWKLFTPTTGTDTFMDMLSGMTQQIFPGTGFPGPLGFRNYIVEAGNNPFPGTQVLDMQGGQGGNATQQAANGINVGSSSTAFTPGASNYGARITTFAQSAQVSSSVFTSGGNRRFLVSRSFTNNTGGSLTIREVGMGAVTAGKISLLVGDIVKNYLALRAVVADFVVPDLAVAMAEFQIQI